MRISDWSSDVCSSDLEQVDLAAGIENNPQALDDFLDGVFEKYPDSDDLLTAVVLSASPTEIKVARSANEIITITDKKVLAVVARSLGSKAPAERRLQHGSVVYIHQLGEGRDDIVANNGNARKIKIVTPQSTPRQPNRPTQT